MSRYRQPNNMTNGWVPVVDSVAITMIVMAYFVFFYLMVGYRLLEVFYKPSSIMVIMMTTGIALGYSIVGAEFRFNYASFTLSFAGILATISLLTLNFMVGALRFPAQGVVIEMSPILLIFFYASVGVAEEMLFTLAFFGSLVRMAGTSTLMVVLYAMFTSILFAVYHNFAAIQLFGTTIFKATSYSFILIFGSLILKLLFYFTRHISVSILGHSLFNAIVQAIGIGVVKWG